MSDNETGTAPGRGTLMTAERELIDTRRELAALRAELAAAQRELQDTRELLWETRVSIGYALGISEPLSPAARHSLETRWQQINAFLPLDENGYLERGNG